VAPRSAALVWELAFTALVVVVASFALKTFVIQSFYIPTSSMEDTLLVDDRITATKLAPALLDVHRGDVVVFHDPDGWAGTAELPQERGPSAWIHGVAQALGLAPESSDDFIVKRVIGLPGDRVECAGAGAPVSVNGQPLDETYLKAGVDPSDVAFDVEVPPDSLWLMGDNRAASADSRFHIGDEFGGAVPIDRVVGVAQLRVWPFDRFGLLRNPGAVFRDVPPPS
jgi:signal peptidase I